MALVCVISQCGSFWVWWVRLLFPAGFIIFVISPCSVMKYISPDAPSTLIFFSIFCPRSFMLDMWVMITGSTSVFCTTLH